MAGIVQLAPGGTAKAPAGAVSIKLSTTAPAQIVLTRGNGESVEPQFRVSANEVVVVPGEELLIAARSSLGQPFASGTRIGVSFRSPGGAGSEIVRPAAEVGGHHCVSLVRLAADGTLTDVMADGRRGDDGAWRNDSAQIFSSDCNTVKGCGGSKIDHYDLSFVQFHGCSGIYQSIRSDFLWTQRTINHS